MQLDRLLWTEQEAVHNRDQDPYHHGGFWKECSGSPPFLHGPVVTPASNSRQTYKRAPPSEFRIPLASQRHNGKGSRPHRNVGTPCCKNSKKADQHKDDNAELELKVGNAAYELLPGSHKLEVPSAYPLLVQQGIRTEQESLRCQEPSHAHVHQRVFLLNVIPVHVIQGDGIALRNDTSLHRQPFDNVWQEAIYLIGNSISHDAFAHRRSWRQEKSIYMLAHSLFAKQNQCI